MVQPGDPRVDLLILDDGGLLLPVEASVGTLPSDERLSSVTISPAVRGTVEELQSPDWAAREAAARALLEDPFIDEQLLALLHPRPDLPPLDPEARHRLLGIVCDRLAMLPRAALGIRMDQRALGPGVVIEGLIDDMPAKQSGQLRAGDRILAIDGRPILRTGLNGSIFQLERPGQQVRLTVGRPRPAMAPAGPPGPDDPPGPRGADGADGAGAGRRGVAPAGPAAGAAEMDLFEVELVLGSTEQLERIDMPGWGGGSRMGSIRIRSEQVREAMERFGPQVVEVPVARKSPVDELPIEDHPELRELLLVRERIEAGEFVATPSLRAAWQQTLDALRAQAADPTLPQASREFLARVAQRYAEVMPDR